MFQVTSLDKVGELGVMEQFITENQAFTWIAQNRRHYPELILAVQSSFTLPRRGGNNECRVYTTR